MPLSRSLARRLIVLSAGNVLLLLGITLCLKQGASMADILRRCGSDVAPTVLAGLGMTGLIFTGAIDLSIASIVVVAGTIFGILVQRGASPSTCYGACVCTAWVLSMLNGWLVRALRIPAIILTLAGLTFYRGMALVAADLGVPNFSGNISVADDAFHAPGKRWAGWILLVVIVAALLWERSARTSRSWLALGSSPEACRLMGLRPSKILQSAFCASGIFLGLAALVFVTRIQAIEPARLALGFELQVIGAVVLGGASIFGGEGCFGGTILGALFLYFTSQLLTYAGLNPYFQEAVVGALILAVIGLDCALQRQRKSLEELA